MPFVASQVSTVQGLRSSTSDTPVDAHWPEALQDSVPLQGSASEQAVPAASGAWLTPATGSQASSVHGLASSTVGGVPAVQAPELLQASAPLQRFASEQAVPAATGAWLTPVTGSQASAVQRLASSVVRGVPGLHAPMPSQASAPLQTVASTQLVPAETGMCWTPSAGTQLSAV